MAVCTRLSLAVRGVLLAVVAMPLSVTSLQVQADDLLDVYQQARENDPVYRAGFHEHEASREIYEQARAVLLPNVSFDISRTETSQDIVSSDNAVFSQGSTSYPTDEMSLSITQSIYSFSNWAYFKQAKEEVKRVAAELEDVRQELVMRVAEAYFTALRERDSYLAISAEVSALEKHHELVERQLANGLARTTDLLDSQARFMQAQARQIEISNDLRDALQGLEEITGSLPDSLVTLGDVMELASPEPFVAETWVENAQKNNPLILARQSALAAAWQEVRRQKGGHYPTLDLVFTQNNRETQGSLFGGGSEVDTQDLLLRMTLPIYSGGAVSSKVRETLNLHNKAKDELEQTWRETTRETRAAFTGVVGAISKVNALQKSVDAYELAVEAKRTAFESGINSSVSVLDAERDLFIARSDFSAARYDYLLNNLRLKRAAGTLREADLEQINAALQGEDVSTDVDAMQRAAAAESFAVVLDVPQRGELDVDSARSNTRSVVFQTEADDQAFQQFASIETDVIQQQSFVAEPVADSPVTTDVAAAGQPAQIEMQADNWLVQQPSREFVIQLAKGADESGIKRYIRRHQLETQAFYYRTLRENGEMIYVLVSVPFTSVKQAKQAVETMPAAVQRDHWIRRVETLQNNYRQPLVGNDA